MTPDAETFLAALARSRREHLPGPRRRPLVPVTPTSGVSRLDLVTRLGRWGVSWDLARVTVVVNELVGAGRLVRGPQGIYARPEVRP